MLKSLGSKLFRALFIIFLLAILILSVREPDSIIQGYWIWAGVNPNHINQNHPYIYQGLIIQNNGDWRFRPQGLRPYIVNTKSIYLVFRIEGGLPNSQKLNNLLLSNIDDWQNYGADIAGVQLDFDSATAHLEEYSNFLKNLREILPINYSLSITGLGDWILYADPAHLSTIALYADEIVFQLYNGKKPLVNIDDYVSKLLDLNIPFKIGFPSGHNYQKLNIVLHANPYYRGILLFIYN